MLADGPDLAPGAIDRVVETGAGARRRGRGELRRRARPPARLARPPWDAIPDEGARALEPRLIACDDLGDPGDVDGRGRPAGQVQDGGRRIEQPPCSVEPIVGLAPVAEQERGARSPFRPRASAAACSVEDAARRAGIPPDHVRWLEEARVYRFPSTDAALTASLLLASALDVDPARGPLAVPGLSRLPVRRGLRGRMLVAVAVLAAAGALAAAFTLLAGTGSTNHGRSSRPLPAKPLPPPWRILVDVLNGTGDIVRTRQVASRIQAPSPTRSGAWGAPTGSTIAQTAVYYERGGRASAIRLARRLGVITRPLPGGTNAQRLVVVVGPQRGPGQ